MSIIKCPECNREVSSFANSCIHCGFPLQEKNQCIIAGKSYDLTDFKNRVLNGEQDELIAKDLYLFVGIISIHAARKIIEMIRETGEVPKTFDANYMKREAHPQVRCPKCSSTQITTGSRGYSLAWGFIGANKTVNRCAKCGYSWQPKR